MDPGLVFQGPPRLSVPPFRVLRALIWNMVVYAHLENFTARSPGEMP